MERMFGVVPSAMVPLGRVLGLVMAVCFSFGKDRFLKHAYWWRL